MDQDNIELLRYGNSEFLKAHQISNLKFLNSCESTTLPWDNLESVTKYNWTAETGEQSFIASVKLNTPNIGYLFHSEEERDMFISLIKKVLRRKHLKVIDGQRSYTDNRIQ